MSSVNSPSNRTPRGFGQKDSLKPDGSRYGNFKSAYEETILLSNYKQLKVRDLKQQVINNYLTEAKQ